MILPQFPYLLYFMIQQQVQVLKYLTYSGITNDTKAMKTKSEHN